MELSKMTITDLKSCRDFLLELIAEEKADSKLFVNDQTIETLEKLHLKIRTALFFKVMALQKAE